MNQQFFEKQLADLLRANKDRKKLLATKAGYTSVDDYKKDLENAIGGNDDDETIESIPAKKIIHNVTISDASASMGDYGCSPFGDKYEKTMAGIKNEIKTLKSDNHVVILHSLYEFLGSNQKLINPYKDKENPSLDFCGATGHNTPLWTSIIKVLKSFENIPRNEKVLVKIYTDGNDNSSNHGDKDKCRKMIKKLGENNFTITFVATNRDIKEIVRRMDIDETNTLSIENTSEGFEKAFETSYSATLDYVDNVKKGKDVLTGFYKQTGEL